MRRVFVLLLIVGATLLAASPVLAQGGTTGVIQGTVKSADGQPIPGVTVTLTSPSLQGEVVRVTDANGTFVAKPMPPGEYEAKMVLEGMQSATQRLRVNAAQVATFEATLEVAAVSEQVVVVGEAIKTISETSQVAVTVQNDLLESLPLDRGQLSAVQIAPGAVQVAANRFVISGAMSFENSYQVNGVDIVDNVRRTPFTLYVEDAVEETTVQTGSISAEFGRFTGGTINTITKSGGNEFHGSFRDNLTNEDWNGQNSFSPEPIDHVNSVYEATLGGFIVKDRLWFFGSGRNFKTDTQISTNILNLPYDTQRKQTRYEGKLTGSIGSNHRLQGSYMKIEDKQTNVAHGGLTQYVVTLDALDDRETPQELLVGNYSGVLTNNFLVEAGYSERKFTFGVHGSKFPDFVHGTTMWDLGNNVIYNTSLFCGHDQCPGAGDYRNNNEYLAKASYFLSTQSTGSHDFVLGYDLFSDQRAANNYQSGSNFSNYLLEESIYSGTQAHVVNTYGWAYLAYYPVLELAKETDFETEAIFLNDRWQLNDSWSFNLGVRYDKSSGTNESGRKVIDDDSISPRLAATWNPGGNSAWTVNLGYARYAGAIANTVADSSSSAGQPSFLAWYVPLSRVYDGSIPNDVYLQDVYNSFQAIGGINNTSYLLGASISGYSTALSKNLTTPSTDEYTVGAVVRLGTKGTFRADVIHREYNDFYVTRIDTGTGQSVDPILGLESDLGIVENNDSVLERKYDALQMQANYQFGDRLRVGGNLTFSKLSGNIEGETGGSGPTTSGVLSYPEYKQRAWNSPNGRLLADTPIKFGAYAVYNIIDNDRHTLSVSAVQQYLSGTPYGAVTSSLNTSRYVTNPGYVTPPTRTTYYYTDRDAFDTDALTRTDLGLNYGIRFNKVELFAQVDVRNLFNEDAVTTPNTSVSNLASFNPFTTTPVEGVNWRKGSNFGKPTSVNSLQAARTIGLSVGVRF